MKYLYLSLVVVLFFSNCSAKTKVEPGVSLELAEFRKSVLSDIKYDLTFSIPEQQESPILATNTIGFNWKLNKKDLLLDFKSPKSNLYSVVVNSIETEINFSNEHLIIANNLLQEGENSIVITFVAGETSLNRKAEFLYTLFVPDRARTAFPLFDQPNLKAVYKLTLETPSHWEAISNAPLANRTVKEAVTIWDFEESDLISSYLFSFVAGEFQKITRTVNGREMTMLHRETDEEKVARNIDDIFELHGTSLAWLENYTNINFPFKKFDFALIPSFQYGGMEHVGAIQYRASSLFLDKNPTDSRLLSRASLIAHETAHMWFGDLVTMDWFNDVWTKEVFANFMAAKIVNPSFPDINHELNFLIRHYPSAYSVDRTEGANPIRQFLPNLNEAGTMYGAIIYNKAPIMMRQLELLVGEEVFQKGMQEYLATFAFSNATWPDLVSILDSNSDADLTEWSEVWVNTAGRPHFAMNSDSYGDLEIIQEDPLNKNRVWPQVFSLTAAHESELKIYDVFSNSSLVKIKPEKSSYFEFWNSNGKGYGLFPSSTLGNFEDWDDLDELEKASEFINIYENILEGNINPKTYLDALLPIIEDEENQLLLNLEIGHLNNLYWNLLSTEKRMKAAPVVTGLYYYMMEKEENPSRKKIFFNAYSNVADLSETLDYLFQVWNKEITIENLSLSENDYIRLASTLAIKLPEKSEGIITQQESRIKNPDSKRRFQYLIPSLSNQQSVRDQFFESLKQEKNRETESWVLSALGNLHHPLRVQDSEKYILPSLELLQEIQQTGDIFFPAGWTGRTLGNYSSDSAVKTVRDFLNERPNYNHQLKLKILQAADPIFRANAIKKKWM